MKVYSGTTTWRTMLGLHSVFVLLAILSWITTSAAVTDDSLLDCDNEVTRSASSICFHFEGQNVDSYFGWYIDRNIETEYSGMVYLTSADPDFPEDGTAVHWAVDGDYFKIAVAVRATGWVGFGISEGGGMLGTDMVLFEAANPDVLVDAYTTDEHVVHVDDCEGDWELLYSQVAEEEEFMIVEFRRLLNTSDVQDRALMHDASYLVPPHRVVAAWGNDASVGYHGLNVARGAIRFFGTGNEQETFDKLMDEYAEGSFVVTSLNHEIAAQETEYAHTCFTREDLIAQGVPNTTDFIYMIGFEPIIQEGNEPYLHHYGVYAYTEDYCNYKGIPEPGYAWAPGEGPLSLPLNVGSPLFGDNGYNALDIEIHYNNPTLNTGVIDNSGVRVYWTSQPREEQLGVLVLGDPKVVLRGEPVGDGIMKHTFDCPETCSSASGSESRTVLREFLHMHETGLRMVNEQIRDGEVIRMGAVDYFDFYQNGNNVVQQEPFVVEAGDTFRTTCYYQGDGQNFGLASSEEMCMSFLYYYPRQLITIPFFDLQFGWACGYNLGYPPCDASHEVTELSGVDELERIFGVDTDKCQPDDDKTDPPTQAPNSLSKETAPPTTAEQLGITSEGYSMLHSIRVCLVATMFLFLAEQSHW